jgi:hypothetical protein
MRMLLKLLWVMIVAGVLIAPVPQKAAAAPVTIAAGSLKSDRTFEMDANEVCGAARKATVKGSVAGDYKKRLHQWLWNRV